MVLIHSNTREQLTLWICVQPWSQSAQTWSLNVCSAIHIRFISAQYWRETHFLLKHQGMPHTYCQHSISLNFSYLTRYFTHVLNYMSISDSTGFCWHSSETNINQWQVSKMTFTYKLCVGTHRYLYHKKWIPNSISWMFHSQKKAQTITLYAISYAPELNLASQSYFDYDDERTDGTNELNLVAQAKKCRCQISSTTRT